MRASRILAIEFMVGIGVSSWAAMKKGYWPWPPSVMRTALAFGVLGILAAASEELAALLGAGFIIANTVSIFNSNKPFAGGVPEGGDYPYKPLRLGESNPPVAHRTYDNGGGGNPDVSPGGTQTATPNTPDDPSGRLQRRLPPRFGG